MATKYRYHVGDRDIPGTGVSAMEVIASELEVAAGEHCHDSGCACKALLIAVYCFVF